MSVLFSPFGNQQFSASGTALAVGHKLYTYAAGSSTPLATYTDSTGSTPQTNPIILNSLGMPTNGQIWLTSGLSYKFVWKDASDVLVDSVDDVTGVTGTSSVTQWVASGLTPTYVSATSFTLSGDQTSTFTVGRRLQSAVTAGTTYSTITASAYGALTTVTVTNTSGVLDSGLSAVNYGLISSVNDSLPRGVSLTNGTAVATTSGTSVDFTGIPSWVKRITLLFRGVSSSGTSNWLVRIGSGSFDATGYTSAGIRCNNGSAVDGQVNTLGFVVDVASAGSIVSGTLVLTRMSTNLWIESHCAGDTTGGSSFTGGGSKTLAGTLDRIRLITANGTDTFDAGSINILYE